MENQYQNGQQQQPHQPQQPNEDNNSSSSSSSSSGGGGGGGGGGLMGERRAAGDEAFRAKLRQMALPLAPLVQLTTGDVHPAFPGTLLNFWLLTDAQLEELAHFYHQRTPCRWTFHYPCPITFWAGDLPLEEKRRRIGKFIGLRGCDTPVALRRRPRSEDEILEDARRARVAEDEEEVWRRKLPWYY